MLNCLGNATRFQSVQKHPESLPETDAFFMNRKGHVIAKKFTRQVSSRLHGRRVEAQNAQNADDNDDSPQRKPLPGFPEGGSESVISSCAFMCHDDP